MSAGLHERKPELSISEAVLGNTCPVPQNRHPEPSAGSNRLHTLAFLALLAGFVATYLNEVWNTTNVVGGVRYFCLQDDAMICMRHAANFASGLGPVWNAGALVQGFTNPGWTLVMTAVHLFHLRPEHTSLAVQLLNLLLEVVLICGVNQWLKHRTNVWLALLGACSVAFSVPLLYWSIAGFEVTLQAILVTAALVLLIPHSDPADVPAVFGNRSCLAPIFLAIAFVVRPDSMAFLVPVAVLILWLSFTRNVPGVSIRVGNIAAVTISAAIAGFVLLAQFLYYGNWLPNTYYLKIADGACNFGRGFEYLLTFIFQSLNPIVLLGLMLFAVATICFSRQPQAVLASTVPVACFIAYVVWIGGDVFQGSRFFAPVVPILVVFAMLGIHRTLQLLQIDGLERLYSVRSAMGLGLKGSEDWKDRLKAVLCLAFILINGATIAWCGQQLVPLIDRLQKESLSSLLVARGLSTQVAADRALIGVFWAGTTPYFMPQYRFHDMLGKCDAHIAHSKSKWGPPGHTKWDFEYSFKKVAPNVLVTSVLYSPDQAEVLKKGLAEHADYGFAYELWFNEDFDRLYKPNRLLLRAGDREPSQQQVYLRSVE